MVVAVFRVVYGRASKFKYITQALSKINDEGYMELLEDGLRMWLMSPDKTSMAVVFLPSHSLDEYTVETPGVRMTVRVDELHRIVRRAGRNDILTLELDPGTQSIQVTLTDRKIGVSRTFTLPLINMSGEEFRELKLQSTARFTIEASDLKLLVSDAKIVGDTVTLEAEEDVVKVRVQGEDKEYLWELRVGDPLLELHVDERAVASYSRSSLEIAAKPAAAADTVRVEFSTNYPLQLSFNLPGGEKMVVYIAPVVE
jgi:proliferating cell nuclear antigen